VETEERLKVTDSQAYTWPNLGNSTRQRIRDVVELGCLGSLNVISYVIRHRNCVYIVPFSRHSESFVESRKFFLPPCIWHPRWRWYGPRISPRSLAL